MVQWLGLPCFSLLRAGLGPIPGSGTKIPQATMCPPPKKKKRRCTGKIQVHREKEEEAL